MQFKILVLLLFYDTATQVHVLFNNNYDNIEATDGEFHSRFYLYMVAIFPNPNSTWNPGLAAF